MSNKEFRDLLVDTYENANVILYGVPFDQNSSINAGSSLAPSKIRDLSWWLPPYSMNGKSLKHIKIFDCGDIDCHKLHDDSFNVEIFNDNKLKLIFGGDHSISIPFQKEFIKKTLSQNKKPVIVHVDAHCDICNEYLGSKFSHACTLRRALDNGLEDKNLFMIGIREFEKDGYDYLLSRRNDVHLFKSTEVLEKGLDRFFKEIKKRNSDEYAIYISFDIDSIDCGFAPGTGTPETCGLTPTIIRDILKFLSTFSNIKCLDLVEVSPPLDINDITSWCAIKLIYDFFENLNLEN